MYGELRNELRAILPRLFKFKDVKVVEGTLCTDRKESFEFFIKSVKCPLADYFCQKLSTIPILDLYLIQITPSTSVSIV